MPQDMATQILQWSPAPTLHVQSCFQSPCKHLFCDMFWACALCSYHGATTIPVLGPNTNREKNKMVRSQPCQRCWNRMPRARRMHWLCGRRVGPGCWPERCLMVDASEGENRPSICRDCWPAYGPAPVSQDFYEIWKIMKAKGF